jgi:enoyl-CoA hydratase/carnithine racemase
MAEHLTMAVADRVACITLSRPPANAFDLALSRELGEAVREAGERDDVGAIVLTGGRRLFAAGADLQGLATATPAEAKPQVDALGGACDLLEAIPKPSVAAINGYALGGGLEVALACDLRIAADSARLGQPEILLGIIPGGGGTQRLARLVGPARAKELIWSGRQVRADEALAIGLVDRVVPAAALEDAALAWAEELAAGAVVAMGLAKRAIDRGLDGSLDAGLAEETAAFAEVFATEDAETGIASFKANGPGKATFRGR